jgi:hypothetical protein
LPDTLAWKRPFLQNGVRIIPLLCSTVVPLSPVAKRDHIPSRRTGKTPLGAKVFSYYTQEERRLLEKAAKQERRSLSSFVALASIERAQRIIAGK